MKKQERVVRTFQRGQVIFMEGDPSGCMYDIVSGVVGIFMNYGKPEQKRLVELQSDDFFGEMGLVNDLPRSATAVALERGTKVEVISEETFGEYLKAKPGKVLMIMQSMSGRIRGLSRDYINACRAVAEMMDNEKNGKKKSPWLKKAASVLVNDFAQGVDAEARYNVYLRQIR